MIKTIKLILLSTYRFFKKYVRDFPVGVILFMAITVLFHVAWRLGSPLFVQTDWYQSLSDFFAGRVYRAAAWINEYAIGRQMMRFDGAFYLGFIIQSSDEPVIRYLIIDHTCSGLKQLYQALVLFLIYPGPWKHKCWYIPSVLAIMHLTNIFRVVILSLTMVHAYHHWDLVHDWIVRPMFYVVLFVLWVLWDNYRKLLSVYP